MPIAKGALNMPQKYTWRFDHYPVSEELPVSVFNDDTWFITNTEIPFFHFHDTLEITYWVFPSPPQRSGSLAKSRL